MIRSDNMFPRRERAGRKPAIRKVRRRTPPRYFYLFPSYRPADPESQPNAVRSQRVPSAIVVPTRSHGPRGNAPPDAPASPLHPSSGCRNTIYESHGPVA